MPMLLTNFDVDLATCTEAQVILRRRAEVIRRARTRLRMGVPESVVRAELDAVAHTISVAPVIRALDALDDRW